MAEFWDELAARLHPRDVPAPACWRRHYQSKYRLALRLRPRSLCEIGVRAGYSAFAFLWACPECFVLGIDNDSETHGGVAGLVRHAQSILAGRLFALMLGDSQRLERLPGSFELVHVDGDHSYAGTRHDLELAWQASAAILVDDYHAISEVRRACDEFFARRAVRVEPLDDKQVLFVKHQGGPEASSGEESR
jgi:predicted O-methyltransferase YrrM